jgi:hypothetical protein
VIVVVAVLGALAALSFVRYIVIFGTALTGAWTSIIGGLALYEARSGGHVANGSVWVLYPLGPAPTQGWVYVAWFGLAVLGVLVQLSTTSKLGGPKKPKQKS